MSKNLFTQSLIPAASVALSLTMLDVNPAQAITFSFSVDNFVHSPKCYHSSSEYVCRPTTYGGKLSGTFSGEDLNNDNILEYQIFQVAEVTDFVMEWSDLIVPAPFSYSLRENIGLIDFQYDLISNKFLKFYWIRQGSYFVLSYNSNDLLHTPWTFKEDNYHQAWSDQEAVIVQVDPNQSIPEPGNVGAILFMGAIGWLNKKRLSSK